MQPEDNPNQLDITIHGHPSPAKVVQLPDDLARRFAHLALHWRDLSLAREFLDECERHSDDDNTSDTILTALVLTHQDTPGALR